jgi:hypothetical protein
MKILALMAIVLMHAGTSRWWDSEDHSLHEIYKNDRYYATKSAAMLKALLRLD